MPSRRLVFLAALAALAAPVLLSPLQAAAPPRPAVPLYQRIDQLINARLGPTAPVAPRASDPEFLRRVTLDLTGTIPTSDEARRFLADKGADQRSRLIDRLLASPEHARHLATVFDVMLMERRPDRSVPKVVWTDFLRQSFAANKPWDVLAREVLSGDEKGGKERHRVKFFLERSAEPHLVTRDVGRLFLGSNYQCAQCHDHPRIDAYRQEHYYGLFAFVSRTSLAGNRRARVGTLTEKADGEVTYQSVFDPKKVTKTALPRVPDGPALRDPPRSLAGPRYSRLARLAPEVTRADYAPFRRNIANRLWALLMGQGLVEPLDTDHPGNPPVHPELLDLLADEITARKFDVRGFLREVALSDAYQRSSALPEGVQARDARPLSVARLKPLSPEQLALALMQATGLTDSFRLGLGKKASEPALYARLAPSIPPFVRAFGGPAGTPASFEATSDQALFLANGPTVRSWLAPRSG